MGRSWSKAGMVPSTQSHSQSMCSTSSGEKYFSPSLRSWPSWEWMGRRKGSMEPSTTPRRRICTSWATPAGSFWLRSTSTVRLLMPHQ